MLILGGLAASGSLFTGTSIAFGNFGGTNFETDTIISGADANIEYITFFVNNDAARVADSFTTSSYNGAIYDYVLIDCPPILGVLMVNALAASNRIIVPVQTEFLALKGLDRMIKTMDIMQTEQENLFNYTIVPTMFDKRTKASVTTLNELRNTYKNRVWSGVIPVDTKFRDASLEYLPISLYAKNCRGSFAYETLLNYLL